MNVRRSYHGRRLRRKTRLLLASGLFAFLAGSSAVLEAAFSTWPETRGPRALWGVSFGIVMLAGFFYEMERTSR